jgi:hypothetical protein
MSRREATDFGTPTGPSQRARTPDRTAAGGCEKATAAFVSSRYVRLRDGV